MDLDFTPQQQAFPRRSARLAARQRAARAAGQLRHARGLRAAPRLGGALAEGGWSSVIWPKELGGRGCDLIEWLIFEEEYHAPDAPMRVNQNGILLLGPTLMEFGTARSRRRASCRAWRAATTCGRRAGASPMPAPTWPRSPAAPSATATTTWSTARRPGRRARVFANWLFGLFRSDPESRAATTA
jgi:alkylation response protein AidB-like acyl-CoA dehydrogenase